MKLRKKKTEDTNVVVSDKKSTKKKGVFKNIFAGFVLFCLVVGLIVGCVGLKMMKDMIDESPTLSVSDFNNTESSKIYDLNGNIIADIGLVNRENVSYEQIPQSFIDAIVAVEDSRYFEHNGFDLPRFVKSMLTNLRTLSFSQGASTLTMQLIRNVYFTDDTTATSRVKSISYKVQQIYLAIKGEMELNKKRIFELYVNRINFGAATSRGIKGAAEYYFGKQPEELTLSESAYLAGVVNAPNGFNAYRHYESAQNRRNTVLYLMREHGYISNEEYQLAVSISLADQLNGVPQNSNKYQAYINEVVDECIAMTGQDPYTATLSIYTYMNRDLQDEIQAIEDGETSIDWPDDLMQCAIVSMDNHTGAIYGIGGGRGDIVAKGYSRVSDMTKQPGSSVKPFLSYALAFEYLGWSTSHTVEDIPTTYRGTNIVIHNFDRSYSGDVLLTEAVGKSLNLPAYRTLQDVSDNIGTKAIVEYLNSLGFNQITTENFDLGYAIGGSSFEVTVEQLAAAHSAMINGGMSVTPHTISRVEFSDGSEPYIPSYPSTRVLSEEAAYQVASLMEQDVTGPYSNFMQLLKRKNFEVYAKTGTTSYDDSFEKFGIPAGAAKDKWMVASTGEITTAVWVGYDIAVDGADTYFSSKKSALNIPGKINNLILNELYKDHTPENVPIPSGLVPITHIKGIYPYKAPVEGLEYLNVTGLIKKENYNLETIAAPSFSATLGSFTVSNVSFSNGFVDATLNWSTYTGPDSGFEGDTRQYYYDEEKGKYYYDMEYTENNGKTVTVKLEKFFTGNAIPSGMSYVATANGMMVANGESSSASLHLPIPSDGSNITVTGYYSFSNGVTSNSISCVIPVADHTKVINVTVLPDSTAGSVTGSGAYTLGSTATLVATPSSGYRFKKWSSGETTSTLTFEVTASSPTAITAEFEVIPTHNVTYYEADGTTVIATVPVNEGAHSGDMTPPAAPSITGKTFDHWNYSGSFPVMADMSATPVYVTQTFTVTFVEDVTGSVIDTKTVNYGEMVSYPSYPTIAGYTWVNWDIGSIDSCTANTTVTAMYTPIAP